MPEPEVPEAEAGLVWDAWMALKFTHARKRQQKPPRILLRTARKFHKQTGFFCKHVILLNNRDKTHLHFDTRASHQFDTKHSPQSMHYSECAEAAERCDSVCQSKEMLRDSVIV